MTAALHPMDKKEPMYLRVQRETAEKERLYRRARKKKNRKVRVARRKARR